MEDLGAPSSPSEARPRGMGVKECQAIIDKNLSNPKVKVLIEKLEKSGCKIGSRFIRSVNCRGPRVYAGAYSRGHGIVLCGNHMAYEDYIVQAMIHELIHAYDDCRAANLDWSNRFHQSCSEIRANHLSGDCHMMRELLRGHLKIKGHEPECVKRRSIQSVAANHSREEANVAVESVWKTCYNDTAPWDKAP
ncbi:hypothetical protein OROGR_003039 [Orobanche gracilis]